MLSDKIKIAAFVSLVLAFAAYTFYLYTHLPVGQQKTSDPVIRGKTAWQKYNCSACHQIYGLGGFLGRGRRGCLLGGVLGGGLLRLLGHGLLPWYSLARVYPAAAGDGDPIARATLLPEHQLQRLE